MAFAALAIAGTPISASVARLLQICGKTATAVERLQRSLGYGSLPITSKRGEGRLVRFEIHTSSICTQRRSSTERWTASMVRVIAWPKAKSGSAGRPSAIAQISSRASMIFWSL